MTRSVPPGWHENPTSYGRRGVLAVLALAGLLIAGYLSLFQLGVVATAWDPLFDPRPVLELTSPVPDALAGVAAYATELVLLAIGGRDRWRTAPWACLALGVVLTIGVVVSAVLVLIQPTVAGAWCTLCLASALLSLLLFALGFDEARAARDHVRRLRAHGTPATAALLGRSSS